MALLALVASEVSPRDWKAVTLPALLTLGSRTQRGLVFGSRLDSVDSVRSHLASLTRKCLKLKPRGRTRDPQGRRVL